MCVKPTMTEEERILTLEEKVARLQFDVYAMQNKINLMADRQTGWELFCKYKDGELVYHKPMEDEPQTDCYVSDLCKHYGDKQICGRCRSRNLFCEAKPQTDCAWSEPHE